jgi:ferrous iron transport protein A
MTVALQSLTSLRAGQKGTVTEIKLPPPERSRLQELGLVSGTPVELVRFALLGDPVEVKVRGYNLSVSRQEAEQILVVPQP